MDLLSASLVVDGASLVTELTVVMDWFELVCSSVFARSMLLVPARFKLSLDSEPAVFVTVVTAPIPLTEDLTTGSSFVLSRTSSCMGIG